MGLLTRVGSAKKGTKSMKTTIPEGIVEFLELSDKDELEWKMHVGNGDRSVVLQKKMTGRVHEGTRLAFKHSRRIAQIE